MTLPFETAGISPKWLAAWWGKIDVDPLPVALRLWQQTRLNNDEPAPTSEGITPSHATKTPDMSAQGRLDADVDPHANAESPFPKEGEASGALG
jgi:hypothetical protein